MDLGLELGALNRPVEVPTDAAPFVRRWCECRAHPSGVRKAGIRGGLDAAKAAFGGELELRAFLARPNAAVFGDEQSAGGTASHSSAH